MRVSCASGDPGERYFRAAITHGKRVIVHLDGVEQKHCITADDEKGFVLRHKLDAEGQPFVDTLLDEIVKETVEGVVKITFADASLPKPRKSIRRRLANWLRLRFTDAAL